MIRAAITLASRGMHVFPCVPRGKTPACEHGCKDATADPDIIRSWWRFEPQYNVAIATGAASDIFAIDIDNIDAEGVLSRLEAEHGALPPTVAVITGKGRHLYFRWPGMLVRNSASKVAPGIEVRGDGGYILAPPSIHPSGRAYAWSVDSASSFAEAPEWLLARITERANGNGHAPAPPSQWRALVMDGVDEGQRDTSATRLAGYLLRRRIDPVVALELLQIWNEARCRPPLPPEDIERIVDSIASKELMRRAGNAG
jgi:hypothetical protein